MIDKMSEEDSNCLVGLVKGIVKKGLAAGVTIGALLVPNLNCVPEEQFVFSSNFPAPKVKESAYYSTMKDNPSLVESASRAYEHLGFARGDFIAKKKLKGGQMIGKLKRTPGKGYGANAITRCILGINKDYDRRVLVAIEKGRDFNILHYLFEGDNKSFLEVMYAPKAHTDENNVLVYRRFKTENGRVKQPLPPGYKPDVGTQHLTWDEIISHDILLLEELGASIFSEEDIAEAQYHRYPSGFINSMNSKLDKLKELEGRLGEVLKIVNPVAKARQFEKLLSYYHRVTQVPHRDQEVNDKINAIKERFHKMYDGLYKIHEYRMGKEKDQVGEVLQNVESCLRK